MSDEQKLDRLVTYLSPASAGLERKTVTVKDEDYADDMRGLTMRAHNVENLVSVFVPWHLVVQVATYNRDVAAVPGYS